VRILLDLLGTLDDVLNTEPPVSRG